MQHQDDCFLRKEGEAVPCLTRPAAFAEQLAFATSLNPQELFKLGVWMKTRLDTSQLASAWTHTGPCPEGLTKLLGILLEAVWGLCTSLVSLEACRRLPPASALISPSLSLLLWHHPYLL